MTMIVGYYVGGSPEEIGQTPLCPVCAVTGACGEGDPGSHSITYMDEADAPTHCEDCGTLIPHALTTDGLEYVVERIVEYLVTGSGSRSVIREWAAEYAAEYVEDLS